MKRFLLMLTVILGMPASLHAQTRATTTTLTAAVDSTQRTIAVTSNTGFTVGNLVFVDTEAMEITAISGTTISVTRGAEGTAARNHANAEDVLTGSDVYFRTSDPLTRDGACTPGTGEAANAPWVNLLTGTIWKCLGPTGTAATWNGTNEAPLTYNSFQSGAQ